MCIGKDEISGHGFPAVARTILDEVLGVRPDYIEHQLAHAVRDPNGRAYNRTAHLPERRKMMQQCYAPRNGYCGQPGTFPACPPNGEQDLLSFIFI
jgi:hypothetical protein